MMASPLENYEKLGDIGNGKACFTMYNLNHRILWKGLQDQEKERWEDNGMERDELRQDG